MCVCVHLCMCVCVCCRGVAELTIQKEFVAEFYFCLYQALLSVSLKMSGVYIAFEFLIPTITFEKINPRMPWCSFKTLGLLLFYIL